MSGQRSFNAIYVIADHKIAGASPAQASDSGSLQVVGGAGIGGASFFGDNVTIETNGTLEVQNTDHASTSDGGALKVLGGAGIKGNTCFGGNVHIETGGVTSLADTTGSTSIGSGALTVAGGVGISENLYVGGLTSIAGGLYVTGDINASGDLNTISSNEVNIGDRYMYLNAQNTAANQPAGFIANHSTLYSSPSSNTVGDTTSGRIVCGSSLTGLKAEDFVQIHDPAGGDHVGIYQVESVTTDQDFIVRTTGQKDWCQSASAFGTSGVTTAVVSLVSLGVIHFNLDGKMTFGSHSNADDLVLRHPVASPSAPYVSEALTSTSAITHQTTHYSSGGAGTASLPSNSTGTYNGSCFVVMNNSGGVCTVDSDGGNIDDDSSHDLVDGVRMTFHGADNQWFTM